MGRVTPNWVAQIKLVRDLLAVPTERRTAIERLACELRAGRSIVLSTHINSDGDGCGSETALARMLTQRGMSVSIVNPTPWPEMFRFLLGDDIRMVELSNGGADVMRAADVIIVLDIAHTVFGHLRASVFPVRPFLVIGILAGVRDILSASAHLTLSGPLTQTNFNDTLISLGVGVGVVLILLLGLLVLRFSALRDDQ